MYNKKESMKNSKIKRENVILSKEIYIEIKLIVSLFPTKFCLIRPCTL